MPLSRQYWFRAHFSSTWRRHNVIGIWDNMSELLLFLSIVVWWLDVISAQSRFWLQDCWGRIWSLARSKISRKKGFVKMSPMKGIAICAGMSLKASMMWLRWDLSLEFSFALIPSLMQIGGDNWIQFVGLIIEGLPSHLFLEDYCLLWYDSDRADGRRSAFVRIDHI
jgi:hypothetical protein